MDKERSTEILVGEEPAYRQAGTNKGVGTLPE
jgi:hypothetical protein